MKENISDDKGCINGDKKSTVPIQLYRAVLFYVFSHQHGAGFSASFSASQNGIS